MIGATTSTTLGRAIAAIRGEGGSIPSKLTKAQEARQRLEFARTAADNVFQQRIAQLGDQLADDARRGIDTAETVQRIERALTLASRSEISNHGAWDAARRALDADLNTALAESRDTLAETVAKLWAEIVADLPKLAAELPVSDLSDAEAVVRVGGRAAADAALALDILGRASALQSATRRVCGPAHDKRVGARVDQVLRVCVPTDLDQALDLSRSRDPLWSAARAGIPLRYATDTDYATAVGMVHNEHTQKHPQHQRFDVMA